MKNAQINTAKTSNTRKSSKLSQGPKNPHHKTFLHNEHLIDDALCAQLSGRRIDIKAKEIYTNAGVTPPTFYLHYHSSNDARVHYERKLVRSFYRTIPPDPKPEVIYTCLTNFIAKNQKYFLATTTSGDYYVLSKIIKKYRQILAGDEATDRTFRQYLGSIIVSISCWIELDGITPTTTKACSDYLIRIHPMRYWDR